MKRLWDRIVRWFRSDKIGYGTAHREVCGEPTEEIMGITGSQSLRDELVDIILDNQLDRARAFGQAHRRNRSK